MSVAVRRGGGAAVALALLAVAWAVSSRNRARLEDTAAQEAQTQVDASLAATRTSLEKMGEHLLDAARTGSLLRSLEALVTSSVDEATFQDFLRSETAWEPYRKFDASGLFIGDRLVTSTGDEALLAGAGKLVDDARASGTATTWVSAKGRPARLAAARMQKQTPNGGVAVVVVLGEWLTPAALGQAADPSAAVAVTAGGVPLVAAGPGQSGWVERALSTSAGPTLKVAKVMLGPEVGLLVALDAAPAVSRAQGDARRFSLAAFLAALVGGGLTLAFFLWPRKPAVEAELLRETTLQLKKSQEELQKVSTRLSQPGIEAFTPGDTVSVNSNRYRVVAPLGEGGMARVSVAAVEGQEGFRRLFVLKRLKAELLPSAEAVAQFIDEARLGASLVHSNIVPVFDFGRDAEGYYLAQEYIMGRNLDALAQAAMAKTGKPLPVELVLFVAQETLRALDYAHHRADDAGKPLNLVHRDVSPNNLMASERGEVKLLDFGIVKSENRLTQTTPGIVKGNLFFMSPEQARGLPVDARSDLFSLGMVLFVLAAGHTLYGGNTSYDVLTRAALGPVEEDLELIRQLPAPLGPLVEKALKFEPGQRYASAGEFLAAVTATGRVGSAQSMEVLVRDLFARELEEETNRLRGRTEA